MIYLRIKNLTVAICALALSGCVSASLDDVGLESTNVISTREQAPSSLAGSNQDLTQLRTSTLIPDQPERSLGVNNSEENTLVQQSIGSPQVLGAESVLQVENTFTSSTLEANTRTNGDEIDREAGIQQIRAKAKASGNNRPNIHAEYVPTTKHLTKAQQHVKRAELQAEALAASGAISNDELLLRKRRIAELNAAATGHYNRAVSEIKK